jgi:uncharacterized protein YegL
MNKRPGGELATRPLHFIWICDCSGSMRVDGKIQALNFAIREAIPEMRRVANDNPYADVQVRAIRFSSGAQWHISQPTPVDSFTWTDLAADGVTDMGRAFTMVAEQLQMPPMAERALPPVLVLVSDGQPTDDWAGGLKALMEQPWGKKSVRISIAIGEDADDEVLQKFIGHAEMKPCERITQSLWSITSSGSRRQFYSRRHRLRARQAASIRIFTFRFLWFQIMTADRQLPQTFGSDECEQNSFDRAVANDRCKRMWCVALTRRATKPGRNGMAPSH